MLITRLRGKPVTHTSTGWDFKSKTFSVLVLVCKAVAGDKPLSVQLPEPSQWPYQDNLLFRHRNPKVAKQCHHASDCLHRWRFSPATLVPARGFCVSLLLKPEVGHPRAGAGSEDAPHSQRYETILKQTPNGEEDPLVGSREHPGILFSSKMEQSTDTHNTDESPRQHVRQKKPGRKRCVLRDSAYVGCYKRQN